ncbi:ABC transporter permease [Streptomyces fenghuangensis]|uniref:ABC transporter permease n=1 Tax=Streptomyces chitinivorans TaxID=1257027 RepID=A0ABW7I123_9ACTN|nr:MULTISPECIES: ABC transporter permease [Streptomyces]MCG3043955.1 ABC transporter permease [Streptomyces sp. ICN903]MDH2410925.1 ABC transporter permease [Streptomyces chitinivorans]
MALTLVHTRYQLLRTIRIPIALVGSAFFPAASMIFFVVPAAGDDPTGAVYATASMVVFASIISNLFGHGIGVAEDRAQPWDPYTRTLPVGLFPNFAGRIITGLMMMLLSMLPVVVIAAVFTEASVTVWEFLAGLVVLIVASLPFMLMGLAIGYLLSTKAALAVVQIIFFPLAFAGGLLSAPDAAPGFVKAIAPYVPSRGAVELMWAAVGDFEVNPTAVVSLVVWTAAVGAVAVYAYRRDEGRRYR